MAGRFRKLLKNIGIIFIKISIKKTLLELKFIQNTQYCLFESLARFSNYFVCILNNTNKKLTPIIALSSDIVTCLALSTAAATCCWCS